jgi:hypothetical protein
MLGSNLPPQRIAVRDAGGERRQNLLLWSLQIGDATHVLGIAARPERSSATKILWAEIGYLFNALA